jgi:hypothetical protein
LVFLFSLQKIPCMTMWTITWWTLSFMMCEGRQGNGASVSLVFFISAFFSNFVSLCEDMVFKVWAFVKEMGDFDPFGEKCGLHTAAALFLFLHRWAKNYFSCLRDWGFFVEKLNVHWRCSWIKSNLPPVQYVCIDWWA